MFVKKSIVLKSMDGSQKKAILTLENDGFETSGNLRLYNFPSDPSGIISLGIYADGRVEKAGLSKKQNSFYTFGCGLKRLPEDFSCAVVNICQGQSSAILYGNNGEEKGDVFDSVFSALSQTSSASQVEQLLDENGIDYEDNLKEEIEEEIDKCMGNCSDCKYKQFYYEQKLACSAKIMEDDIAVADEMQIDANFYIEVQDEIDRLFENNPSEEYLENLIPHSKWVKVKVDEENNFYVLGLVYEDEKLKYICYGVPGVYSEIPPKQLAGFPVWFPLDENNPQNFGYWLTYQDADTGESVKAVLI